MTIAAASSSPGIRRQTWRPRTAAELPDLLVALDDVPAERVLLDPPPGTATEADVVRCVDGEPKILCELVDVLSRGNTGKEMDQKRKEHFESGTKLVWEFDPEARTVAVYTSPENPQVLDQTNILEGGTVLPGFTMDLAKLFAELDRAAT